MPFDSTKPNNGSLISATELREQFTSLKALIDALDARVAALEPLAALTASGFGAPEANGVLTEQGTFDGKPFYLIAGGWYCYWHVALNSWEIGTTNPNEDRDRKYNSNGDRPSPAGVYVNDGGPIPAGTVA